MTTDKTYTNQELVDRIERATRDKDKLQKVGEKPICHYINGTKLYTKEYVEELERQLEIAKEALEKIYASNKRDGNDNEYKGYEQMVANNALMRLAEDNALCCDVVAHSKRVEYKGEE